MLDHGLAAVWGVDRGEDALGTIEWATVAGDIVAVVTLLVFARLGNHFRPTTFLATGLVILGLSTAGSLIPGSATLLAWVMLVSALGAGLTMVASMLIVLHSTPRQGRGFSLGFWVAMYPLAMLAGQILDINSPQNWRSITYGILAATVVVLVVVLTQPHREFVGTFDTFDLVGARCCGWSASPRWHGSWSTIHRRRGRSFSGSSRWAPSAGSSRRPGAGARPR